MEIQLTNGYVAIVDDRDYEWLSKFKWHYHNGYACRASSTKNDPVGKQHEIGMHRVVWEYYHGPITEGEIDHINGDGIDNRLNNVRLATHQQNCANRHKVQEHSSRFKGVSWSRWTEKWRACIRVDGVLHHLGYFDNEEEAAREYDKAALAKWGERARLNFS